MESGKAVSKYWYVLKKGGLADEEIPRVLMGNGDPKFRIDRSFLLIRKDGVLYRNPNCRYCSKFTDEEIIEILGDSHSIVTIHSGVSSPNSYITHLLVIPVIK